MCARDASRGGRRPPLACNALVAAVDLSRHRTDGYHEPALLTVGQDTGFLAGLPADHPAADIVDRVPREAVR
jgi:hypothetical protein